MVYAIHSHNLSHYPHTTNKLLSLSPKPLPPHSPVACRFLRIWFFFFLTVGIIMIGLAVMDCCCHFLPQPLPILAACGCCGCVSATRTGGRDLEDAEGPTDFADEGAVCTMCWFGPCAFHGGTVFTLFNISVALLTMPRSLLLTPIWAWNIEAAYALALATVELLIAAWIVIVSCITPKSLWAPLWFLDPLRSFFGLGCIYIFLGWNSATRIYYAITTFIDTGWNAKLGSEVLFSNFYIFIGILYIVFSLFNMHCKSCCTCTCATCDGVPPPYPLLAYACEFKPCCKITPKKCREGTGKDARRDELRRVDMERDGMVYSN